MSAYLRANCCALIPLRNGNRENRITRGPRTSVLQRRMHVSAKDCGPRFKRPCARSGKLRLLQVRYIWGFWTRLDFHLDISGELGSFVLLSAILLGDSLIKQVIKAVGLGPRRHSPPLLQSRSAAIEKSAVALRLCIELLDLLPSGNQKRKRKK